MEMSIEERGGGGVGRVSDECLEDEREGGDMFFGAGGKDGPQALPIGSAFRAACALGGGAVNHHLPDGLFRPVVGWLDQGIGEEAEIRIAVFLEAFGDVFRRRLGRGAAQYAQHPFPGLGQFPLVGVGLRLGLVIEAKQFSHRRQGPYGVLPGCRVGMTAEEAEFPDKMGKAELGRTAASGQVGMIGRILVAADNPGVGGAKHDGKNLGGAFPVNVKDNRISGSENPGPEALSLLPMPRFVDIEDRLPAKAFDSFSIRLLQRLRNALQRLGDFSPADRSLTDILQKRRQRRIGGMRLGVQKGQRSGKVIANKSCPTNFSGQFSPMKGTARGTIVGRRPKFPANHRVVAKVDLLPHLVGCWMRNQNATAGAGQGGWLKNLDLIYLVRRKRRPEMRCMSRLAANAALPLSFQSGRLDDVR